MNIRRKCGATLHNREIIVVCVISENVRPTDVAKDFGISARTVHK